MPYSSPFEPALRARGAAYGLLGDVHVPLRFGETAQEVRALRGTAGLVDLPWRGAIEMAGRDRARFLHGMCTNDIKKLRPGDGCLAAVVNRQGKMVGDLLVLATEDVLLLLTDRLNLATLVDTLLRFVVADRVEIRASGAAVAGLYGPSAPALLGLPPSADFAFSMRDGVAVARDPTLGVEGALLVVPPGRPEEIDRLLAHGVAPAGFEAYETLRIANGFPRWGADMDGGLLPMEAGLEPLAVSYTKGCYIGQEVIQRVKTYSEPPRMLVQLAFEGTAAAGARVLAGDQEAGVVTSGGEGLALALVRKEHRAAGTPLRIEPGPAATVRALPWHARVRA